MTRSSSAGQPGDRLQSATTRPRRRRPRRHRHAVGLGGDDGASEHETALKGKVVVSMANALSGSVASSSRSCRRVARSPPTCRRPCRAPRRGRLPPSAGQGTGQPRRADRLRRADLRRRPRRHHQVADIVAKIPGCRPLDAGELSNAMAIEAFTAVLLQLNIRYKTRVAPKLTGIKRDPRQPHDPAALRHRAARGGAVRAAGARPHVHVRDHPVRLDPPRPCRDVPCLRRVAASVDRPRPPCDPACATSPTSTIRCSPGLGSSACTISTSRRGRRRASSRTWRRSTRCRCGHAAMGLVGDPRHPRLHRHGHRSWVRLSGGRQRVLRCVAVRPFRHRRPLLTRADARVRSAGEAATSTIRSSAILSTSSCGSRRPPTSRRGTRCGGRDARVGTSKCSALALASWARRSICTVAERTSSSRTTSASGRSPRRRRASRSSSTGCTRRWSRWTARRCRRASATSCSSTPCARSGRPPRSG